MTATQGDLFAAEAISRAEQHADALWLTAARNVVWQLIQAGEAFTTDQCWERLNQLDVRTHEPRALGAIIRAAAAQGLIRNTGMYVKSTRPDCHSRPIPQWAPVRRVA